MLESVKTSLKNSFSMKDLGEAAYILGIKIYRDRSKGLIGLSQDTYIDKEAKKGFFPMSHGIHLSKTQCPTTTDERERMNKVPYASAIGSIMYVHAQMFLMLQVLRAGTSQIQVRVTGQL